MKKVLFSLIATTIFSVSSFANNNANTTNPSRTEVITYTVDGKTYSDLEFNKLVEDDKLQDVKECTVNVTVTVEGQTHTEPVTFEASWWGCALAHIGAFLVSLIN